MSQPSERFLFLKEVEIVYDVIKQQCEILRWNKSKVKSFEIEGRIGFTDGFKAFVFFKDELLIDKTKYGVMDNKIFQKTEKHIQASVSFILKRDIKSNRTIMKLKAESINVYVLDKYVKDFYDCSFYVTDPLSPILIERYGVLVGVAMPTRVSEKESF